MKIKRCMLALLLVSLLFACTASKPQQTAESAPVASAHTSLSADSSIPTMQRLLDSLEPHLSTLPDVRIRLEKPGESEWLCILSENSPGSKMLLYLQSDDRIFPISVFPADYQGAVLYENQLTLFDGGSRINGISIFPHVIKYTLPTSAPWVLSERARKTYPLSNSMTYTVGSNELNGLLHSAASDGNAITLDFVSSDAEGMPKLLVRQESAELYLFCADVALPEPSFYDAWRTHPFVAGLTVEESAVLGEKGILICVSFHEDIRISGNITSQPDLHRLVFDLQQP